MSEIKNVKRFVISVRGIENKQVCVFVNKKGVEYTYDQSVVFNQLKDKFEKMNCWTKYKTYTNTNNLPTFVKELKSLV
jgi:hypothetical protein